MVPRTDWYPATDMPPETVWGLGAQIPIEQEVWGHDMYAFGRYRTLVTPRSDNVLDVLANLT